MKTLVCDVNMYVHSTCIQYTRDSLEYLAVWIVPGKREERSW